MTFLQLWRDERGFVVSAELVLIATIVVLGTLVGLAAYRDSLVQELGDTGAAVGALNQSYSEHYSGDYLEQDLDGMVTVSRTFGKVGNQLTVTAKFKASRYTDQADLGDGVMQSPGDSPVGIQLGVAAAPEGTPIAAP